MQAAISQPASTAGQKISGSIDAQIVEVFCDHTAGISGMRGTENAERVTTLGRGTYQFVIAVSVLEQMALVCRGSGSDLDGAVSAEAGVSLPIFPLLVSKRQFDRMMPFDGK